MPPEGEDVLKAINYSCSVCVVELCLKLLSDMHRTPENLRTFSRGAVHVNAYVLLLTPPVKSGVCLCRDEKEVNCFLSGWYAHQMSIIEIEWVLPWYIPHLFTMFRGNLARSFGVILFIANKSTDRVENITCLVEGTLWLLWGWDVVEYI